MIVDLEDHQLHEKIRHFTAIASSYTNYQLDHLVTPSYFSNEKMSDVCGAGIHYFLSPQAAIGYELETGFCKVVSFDNVTHYSSNGGVSLPDHCHVAPASPGYVSLEALLSVWKRC